MNTATLWWVAAGALIAAELLTGTFYLLMVSTGLAAAGLAATLGAGVVAQLIISALISTGATLAWRTWRSRHPDRQPANTNPDVHLDLGETVHVENWSADGTGTTHYRGAQWQVALAADHSATSGPQRIVGVEGNRLIVQPA
jgi:membrane protein implicated in regulation of membrane protease activity